MNRIEAWITFAAAAMASDKDGSIELQARWADEMLQECDQRWAVGAWGDAYNGYSRSARVELKQ